jgi:hypothetical protein
MTGSLRPCRASCGLCPCRASCGLALELRPIQAYPGSHEREDLEHRSSPALWWALARKHIEVHVEGTAGPSGQVRKQGKSICIYFQLLQLQQGKSLYHPVTYWGWIT